MSSTLGCFLRVRGGAVNSYARRVSINPGQPKHGHQCRAVVPRRRAAVVTLRHPRASTLTKLLWLGQKPCPLQTTFARHLVEVREALCALASMWRREGPYPGERAPQFQSQPDRALVSTPRFASDHNGIVTPSPDSNGKVQRWCSTSTLRVTNRKEVESRSSGLESSEARQKFAGAKAISSDMFFGREVDTEVSRVVHPEARGSG